MAEAELRARAAQPEALAAQAVRSPPRVLPEPEPVAQLQEWPVLRPSFSPLSVSRVAAWAQREDEAAGFEWKRPWQEQPEPVAPSKWNRLPASRRESAKRCFARQPEPHHWALDQKE